MNTAKKQTVCISDLFYVYYEKTPPVKWCEKLSLAGYGFILSYEKKIVQ